MKKIKILLFILMSALLSFSFISCSGNEVPPAPELKEIEGVTFESAEFTYDGTEKSIIAQNIPEGINAEYESNKATDPGILKAKVTLSGEGYKNKILNATLTINKAVITGVTFESAEFTYDGTEKSIIAQNIPEGINAEYESNKATDAGIFQAKVTLSAKGYETKILNAALTIHKADITGISLTENESIKSDGEFHLPTIIGRIPAGVNTEWYFDDTRSDEGVKAIGKYTVKLLLRGNNYNDLIVNGTYEIKINLAGLAQTVVNTFGRTPSAWTFLPNCFEIENYAINGEPPTYSDFTTISSIPTKYIGKQMNVVLSTVNKFEKALTYVNTVHGALNIIEQAYNTFLNNSPDDYTLFSDDTGTFTYSIIISDAEYQINAQIDSVAISLFSDLTNSTYGARVQLTNTTVLKYTVSDKSLKIALNILGASSTQVEFVRDIENVNILNGYVYEYLTVAGKELIASSAYLYIDEKYTTVIGTKGDFIPTTDGRNCEVYSSITGALVGAEVSEHSEALNKTYDTLWYNLSDISGITSIKKVDEQNYYNPDKVYINGNSDTIHTEKASITDWSRRFDIEFKKVCAYKLNSSTGEYESVEFEVPMMFIQEKYADSFTNDFNSANGISAIVNKTNSDKTAIHNGYHVLLSVYNTIKNSVTQNDIKEYCGIIE